MEKTEFEQLLLNTAFCCLASDGNIDKQEIDLIQSIFSNYEQFRDLQLQNKLNYYIEQYNNLGREFINNYFDILIENSLSFEQEIAIIDIAIKTIQADQIIEYSEIKFFKIIRRNLKVSNDEILKLFPEIEMYLEEDIVIETSFDRLKDQFFEITEVQKFESIVLN
ncbi:MAG: hypothetical protein RJA76_51 [Bacteroidota bacterium]|jgi:uncharacterized tellurite resistance protein B-like protein